MAVPAPAAPAAIPTPALPTLRTFGRFELKQLLGRSQGTMVWLAHDPRDGRELMLTLPRSQPADAPAQERWLREARLAARLDHPQMARVAEIGVQDHWPFIAVDRKLGITLPEWLAAHALPPPVETMGWLCDALRGLAFAHEAGVAHRDLQLHHLLIGEQGQIHVMGFAAALDASDQAYAGDDSDTAAADAARLHQQRGASQRDVLAAAVLLHQLLVGQPVLDEPDTAVVISRMAPTGRDIVRLPWSGPHAVPEALRAIANRGTAAQERQRYLNARTLLRALEGWREAEAQGKSAPLALLLDRMRSVGHLPAMPGVSARVARLAAMEGQHTAEIGEQILQDIALSFELLRQVNSAQVQGTQMAGSGPVLTVRRATALLGLAGVRHAATALRAWPGPLSERGAEAMRRLIDRCRLAGHVAQVLRPPGYDPEVLFLLTLLQNLGRLLVQYHFPDEAEQIQQLMRPSPPPADSPQGTPDHPGMSEEAAAFAVLGVDIESLGSAVARHWGLGDEAQHIIHRLPRERGAVRAPVGDADVLRTTASAANEAVDVISTLPAERVAPALGAVAQRYGRALGLDLGMLQEALRAARRARDSGRAVAELPRETQAATGGAS